MEFIWFIPLVGMVAATAWQQGKKWLKRKSELVEEDRELQDLSDWKRYADEARERKNKEFTEWLQEFQELLQKACKHRYKDSSYRWWRCVDCAHEHEWKHTHDCTCRTESLYSRGGIPTEDKRLYRRDDNCPAHGRPRFIANAMYRKGKLTVEESLLWDTTVHNHYLPSPTYDYWDKRRLQQLTEKPEVVRLGIAGQREPIIKGN